MRLLVVGSILFLCLSAFVLPASANNSADSEIRLLILGDSLSAGYGLSESDAFPEQLRRSLKNKGYEVDVINSSVSGDTTAGGLSRVDWALADQPDLVIVELGGNDALRGLSVSMTRNNLDAILARLKSANVRVLLAGMKAPRNLGDEYVQSFDRIFPELADKHGIALYPFFLEGVALEPDLNQPDGIHPNASGVTVIVDNILPYVIAELEIVN